ncbi:AAA family ATPase [Pseudomonas sp. RW10S2]|uniref:AAA family ATPase n=1 Tax=Pseudomonas sp. RW10S2 TaxID=459637 RepID=UPI0016488E4A|nr:AAA family ATPase [Pseudomonas sp. RW10S2]MBC3464865.1 ATP-binding protein [Pseudomonas sp. RW10S2]
MHYDERDLISEQHFKTLMSLANTHKTIKPDDLPWLIILMLCERQKHILRMPNMWEKTTLAQRLSSLNDKATLDNTFLSKYSNDLLEDLERRIMEHLDAHASKQEIRHLLNYAIDIFIARLINIDYRHPKVVATFLNLVIPRLSSPMLVDMTPTTAEISLAAVENPYNCHMIKQPPSEHRGLIDLKFVSTASTPTYVENSLLKNKTYEGAAYLVDFATQNESKSGNGAASTVSPGGLKYLLLNQKDGRLFVVAPHKAHNKNTSPTKILDFLKRQAHIDALIDFTSYSPDGKLAPYLLIIADTRALEAEQQERPTLHISVDMDNEQLSSLDPVERTTLAAVIFNLWEKRSAPDDEILPTQVRRIVNGQFKDGYRDIAGLCRQSTKDEPLKASKGQTRQAGTAKKQPSLMIDAQPVIALLSAHQPPSCCYVIGNNGEGKSFLLRSVVDTLGSEGRRAIGITNASSDRFDFVKGESSTHFLYRGPRSSKSVISNVARARQITQRVINIHDAKHRRAWLSTCLDKLDLSSRYYLVRQGKTATTDSGSIVPLSSKMAQGINADDYEIAMVRKEPDDHTGSRPVIPFSHLSSGEQALTTLLINIIEAAQADDVIVIDEPEISLHTAWQQLLPTLFSDLCSKIQIHFLVATHSPVLIANATWPTDHCFLAQGGELHSISPDKRRSVETVLLDGFKTYTPHNREVHERCARLVADTIAQANQPASEADQPENTAINELQELQKIITTSERHLQGRHADPQSKRSKESDLDLIEKAIAAIDLIGKAARP